MDNIEQLSFKDKFKKYFELNIKSKLIKNKIGLIALFVVPFGFTLFFIYHLTIFLIKY